MFEVSSRDIVSFWNLRPTRFVRSGRLRYLTLLTTFLVPVVFTLSCGSSTPSVSDPTGQQAIIDATNNDLTTGDCSDALTEILPLYNSPYSDNDARLATASAYGCDAEINFFDVLGNLAADANTLSSASMLGLFAQLFPSTSQDKVLESAGYGMSVLMTVLTQGEVIAPADSINSTSDNPGSLLYSDRTGDSNLYMLMMSMAAMGSAASRYAGSNYHPANSSIPFPWYNNTTAMTTDGCTLAAATMNFLDVVEDEATIVSGSAGSQLQSISALLNSTLLDEACEYGCTGTSPPALLFPNWQPTGCTLSSCGNGGHCPLAIRDWTQCKVNTPTDPVGCAAAGLINFLNSGALWM